MISRRHALSFTSPPKGLDLVSVPVCACVRSSSPSRRRGGGVDHFCHLCRRRRPGPFPVAPVSIPEVSRPAPAAAAPPAARRHVAVSVAATAVRRRRWLCPPPGRGPAARRLSEQQHASMILPN